VAHHPCHFERSEKSPFLNVQDLSLPLNMTALLLAETLDLEPIKQPTG
jgi:hypothetical protein